VKLFVDEDIGNVIPQSLIRLGVPDIIYPKANARPIPIRVLDESQRLPEADSLNAVFQSTIADLAGVETIGPAQVAEALPEDRGRRGEARPRVHRFRSH
jgi:hypothetical protein